MLSVRRTCHMTASTRSPTGRIAALARRLGLLAVVCVAALCAFHFVPDSLRYRGQFKAAALAFERVEQFRSATGHLPDSLATAGLSALQTDGIEYRVVRYDEYSLSFQRGTPVGQDQSWCITYWVYRSRTKQWRQESAHVLF
jgi:hypothetical protein